MSEKRTDPHSPAVINPGNYKAFTGPDSVSDLGGAFGRCDHCGKAIRWAVHFTYIPTGERVIFGDICANILELSDDRIKHEMVLLKRRVANELKKMKAEDAKAIRRREMTEDKPEVVEYLEELDLIGEKNYFLQDMVRAFDQYGSLTDGQTKAVENIMEGRLKYAEKLLQSATEIPAAPLKAGRQALTGTVLSTKYQDSLYGMTRKMLVKLEDFNKVYLSVPKALDTDDLVGRKISFEAEIQVSDKDENFGFGKRPTKAKFV